MSVICICLPRPNSLLGKKERVKGMDLLTIKPNQKPNPQEARKHAAVIYTAHWSTVELLSFYIRALIQLTKCPWSVVARPIYIYFVYMWLLEGLDPGRKSHNVKIFHPTWLKLYWRLSDLLDRQPHRHVHIHTKTYSAYFQHIIAI